MLNGAQGDDDEALGGHFGLATGRVGADGDMSKWLVNNYYNLGSNSEKGIIAAATPMDKYLMDVNNGQSYYRPSYMLVAVLKQSRQLWVDHNPQTTFTKQLSNDIEAIYFVRIPQVPSNRTFGAAPVYSFDEYTKTAPADHSQWKMVPTTPRVLPENLKDGLALNQEKVSSIPWPVALLNLSLFWGLIWGFRKLFKFNRK